MADKHTPGYGNCKVSTVWGVLFPPEIMLYLTGGKGCSCYGVQPVGIITLIIESVRPFAYVCAVHHIQFLTECRQRRITTLATVVLVAFYRSFVIDDDHTGCTTCTVNSSCRRILQYIGIFLWHGGHRTGTALYRLQGQARLPPSRDDTTEADYLMLQGSPLPLPIVRPATLPLIRSLHPWCFLWPSSLPLSLLSHWWYHLCAVYRNRLPRFRWWFLSLPRGVTLTLPPLLPSVW